MSNENNLWNSLEFEAVTTPKAILNEQATHFTKMTKNVLLARVKSAGNTQTLVFHFEILAPALNNYRIHICSIQHDLVNWYPLKMVTRPNNEIIECKDEEEFISNLKKELNREDVTQAIKSLYAQSNTK